MGFSFWDSEFCFDFFVNRGRRRVVRFFVGFKVISSMILVS